MQVQGSQRELDCDFHIWHDNSQTTLARIDTGSVAAVITDPPYPLVKREYGCYSVAEWQNLMGMIVSEIRRVLTPTGSAVFVLQPASAREGRTDPWLWKWLSKLALKWNLVQVAYAVNRTPIPCGAATTKGLMREAVKYCCWFGPPNCYRNQDSVLKPIAEATLEDKRDKVSRPSHHSVVRTRMRDTAIRRGGTTPPNVIEYCSTSHYEDIGNPHPAKTQYVIADYWVRYLTEEGDIILDPFCGSGTVGVAALRYGRNFLGVEKEMKYVQLARRRLQQVLHQPGEIHRIRFSPDDLLL
jgi:site-specific DNA-methyltransferase (cytosine-N4-specific)